MILASLSLPFLLAAAPLSVDTASRTVTFTATATGCATTSPLEFLFVGPNSDRDYEALFVTDSELKDIVEACAKVGLPLGHPIDAKACVLRALGEEVTLTPNCATLVKDVQGVGKGFPPIIYTGGTRTQKEALVAATEMPATLFALYDCGQSPLQFNAVLDQSQSYGRFLPAKDFPKGERHTFTLTWNGERSVKEKVLALTPATAAQELVQFSKEAGTSEWNVLATFDKSFTLKQAISVAKALDSIDSAHIKVNGAQEGEFYFRAYLPLAAWRDRNARLAQPPEIHFKAQGISVSHIVEDWSDPNATEPKLNVVEKGFDSVESAAQYAASLVGKTQTMLLYAAPTETLSRLYDFRRAVKGDILNWYIFEEE